MSSRSSRRRCHPSAATTPTATSGSSPATHTGRVCPAGRGHAACNTAKSRQSRLAFMVHTPRADASSQRPRCGGRAMLKTRKAPARARFEEEFRDRLAAARLRLARSVATTDAELETLAARESREIAEDVATGTVGDLLSRLAGG